LPESKKQAVLVESRLEPLFAMPSLSNIILCALSETLIGFAVGLPLARRIVANRSLALALAPITGWAVFNSLALPILTAAAFARTTVALLAAAAILAGLVASIRRPAKSTGSGPDIPVWGFGAAAFLAVVPALALWPKYDARGVGLGEAMFDHTKAAIIDDIVRLGLPPGNPFFAGPGPRLVYYYLWHFTAAVPAALWRTTGWEADIGLTWFTAFASLSLMMGLAVSLSRRRIASGLALLLCLGASLKPLLRLALPSHFLDRALSQYPWPQSWIFQASWAPQHLAAASCTVVAVIIMAQLRSRHGWALVPLLAVVVAAGFESSAWVGGIVFAIAALPIGIALLAGAGDRRARLGLLLKASVALALTVLVSLPLLRDQYLASMSRHPIALQPFAVLGLSLPQPLRRALDLPAYWLILMVIEFPAIYFAGTWAIVGELGTTEAAPVRRRVVVGFALLAATSFIVPWLLASTIANNDLGWRGVLPGVLVLTVFAAAGLARWPVTAPALAVTALALWLLSIPGGLQIIHENFVGVSARSEMAFAASPALWAAVRSHAAPDERVANNPLFAADSVRWPVNISWALLADRRSCWAGWNLARAFVPLPEPDIDYINAQFQRVFAGTGAPDDVRDLATRYSCRVTVVTPGDGAWRHDPFAVSCCFRLAEAKPDRWRIYRVVEGLRDRR
jgi:hypothetical protein